MKRIYFLAAVGLSMAQFSAQTYCIPEFASGCGGGDMIDSFTVPAAGFAHTDTGCSAGAYEDFSSTLTLSLQASLPYDFTITHDYSGQNVGIWADLNNDGTFDETTELIGSGSSGSVNQTLSTITVPAGTPTGNYRMRVGVRWLSAPIPCNLAGYGEAHDYTLTVTPPPTCSIPTAASTTVISSSSLQVSFTAPSPAPSQGYDIYYSTTNTAPTATTTPSLNVAASPGLIPGLSPATTYYVWIRSNCSASDKSIWVPAGNAMTSCVAFVPNYTNSFSTAPGNCWSIAAGGSPTAGPVPGATVSYNWRAEDFLVGNGGTGGVALNLYYFDRAGWLISPTFDLSAAGTHTMSFNYGVTEYYGSDPIAMGSDDVVNVLISTDNGLTWTIIEEFTYMDNISNTSNAFTYTIPAAQATAQVKFAIFGTDGTVDDTEDYDFHVDNFAVTTGALSTSEIITDLKEVRVYPNPFADVVNISDAQNLKSVSVMDMSGRLIKTIVAPGRQINLGELKSGLYILKVDYKDGSSKSVKTIKK